MNDTYDELEYVYGLRAMWAEIEELLGRRVK